MFMYNTKFLEIFKNIICKSLFLLFQILRVLNESAVAVRTKAMKALSSIVAVDPSILGRVSYYFKYRFHMVVS